MELAGGIARRTDRGRTTVRLEHGAAMQRPHAHRAQGRLLAASRPEEVMEHDRRYLSGRVAPPDFEVIGLDRAERADAFAEETGPVDRPPHSTAALDTDGISKTPNGI